jgi:hypothetical protein
MVTDSATSSLCLSPLDTLSFPECALRQSRLPDLRGQGTRLYIVILAVTGHDYEPPFAPNTPLVNAMAPALPLQLEAMPHQDSDETAEFHIAMKLVGLRPRQRPDPDRNSEEADPEPIASSDPGAAICHLAVASPDVREAD